MNTQQASIINISHGLTNAATNILYHYHNSLFDIIFKDLDVNIFNYDGLHSYYHDILVSNNVLTHHHGTSKYAQIHHIKELLLFHNEPPSSFKKEDIQLVHQNISKTHCVFFGNHIANSWKVSTSKNISIIDYGIPNIVYDRVPRTKNILLFNLSNDKNIKLLHQHINRHFGPCDLIENIPGSLSVTEISELLSSYKVCIETSNIINCLMSMSCGCYCITPASISLEHNDLYVGISNYNDIIDIIQKLMSSSISEEHRDNNANKIKSQYDYQLFKELLTAKINQIKYKEFFWV